MTKERALQKAKLYREWAEIRKTKLKVLEARSREMMRNFDWTEPVKIGQGIAGFTEEEMESIMPNFTSNVIKI